MKLLVVDDDPHLRDALQVGAQLQWEDAYVLTASDGEAGLELFFSEEPDIVLLDVTMPRMNGFEVLKAIRQVSDVPVIMLTARADDRPGPRTRARRGRLRIQAVQSPGADGAHQSSHTSRRAATTGAGIARFSSWRPGNPFPKPGSDRWRRAGETDTHRVQAAVPPRLQCGSSAASPGSCKPSMGWRLRSRSRVLEGVRESSAVEAQASRRAGVHRDRARPRLSLRSSARAGQLMPFALLALATLLALNVLLGPLGLNVIQWRVSAIGLNQTYGADGAALALVVPIALAAAWLWRRTARLAAPLALGVGLATLYYAIASALGPDYIRYDGNNERFFLILLVLIVLSWTVAARAWTALDTRPPFPASRLARSLGTLLILGGAAVGLAWTRQLLASYANGPSTAVARGTA